MHDDTEGWTRQDWQLYRELVRSGKDGQRLLSQEAIREVNRRRRNR